MRDGVQCSRNKYDPFHNILTVVTAHGWAMISTVTFEACQRPRKRDKQAVSIAATAKQNKRRFVLKPRPSRVWKLTRQNDRWKQAGRCDKTAGRVKLSFFSSKAFNSFFVPFCQIEEQSECLAQPL